MMEGRGGAAGGYVMEGGCWGGYAMEGERGEQLGSTPIEQELGVM